MNVLTLTRDTKFEGGTKPGYYGKISFPDLTEIQTMDPGAIMEGIYQCDWLPSPHLTAVHQAKTGDNSTIYAYRLKDAKLNDGTTSQNILLHGGNWIEDSLDCILLGMGRSLNFNPSTGKNEPELVSSLTAKTLMAQKLTPVPVFQNTPASFMLEIKNGSGIVIPFAA